MTLALDDVVRVALTGVAPLASVFQNVWHYKVITGGPIDEDAALAAIQAQYVLAFAEISGAIAQDYEFENWEMWVRDVPNHQWDGVAALVVAPVAGTGVGDAIPHGAAMVGRVVTEEFRRQGRTFVPGPLDTNVTNGQLVGATLVDFSDFMLEFADDIAPVGGTMRWCTYNVEATSPHYETASLAAGTVIANSIVGYQRRRKPLVGI